MHIYLVLSFKALGNFLIEIFYFPIWWYTIGFFDLLKRQMIFLHNQEKALAFFVWIKNIGKPMYSQHDFWGHVLSFFIRLFQIIVRGAYLVSVLAVVLTIISVWLALPIISIREILFQLA